ncbi:YqaJ viral recombinase family protein [Oxalobacter sp. OttesenSCG-928-P03]|nr:YqaJ viral recombinase family protein [Oxalobacter sp. OttesenSCG-928-P03]
MTNIAVLETETRTPGKKDSNRHRGAIRLVSTKNMSRESWLDIRNQGIGSSDAACVLGLSPYKSALELWLEKTGRKAADDLSGNEAVFWGTTLEPVIAAIYAERTGTTVRRVNAVLRHPEHPFMMVNLDREVRHPTDGRGILEVKTAGLHSAHLWDDGVPEVYQCQVLHQLAVTGKPWADVAVLIGGQDFRVFRIYPDEEKIHALIEAERDFWMRVEFDIAPEVDGSESGNRALGLMYPEDDGTELDFSEDVRMNALFSELLVSREVAEEATQHAKLLRQRIQKLMGNARTALFANGRVNWRMVKGSTSTDFKRLAEEHPELVKRYETIKEGHRRFVVMAN